MGRPSYPFAYLQFFFFFFPRACYVRNASSLSREYNKACTPTRASLLFSALWPRFYFRRRTRGNRWRGESARIVVRRSWTKPYVTIQHKPRPLGETGRAWLTAISRRIIDVVRPICTYIHTYDSRRVRRKTSAWSSWASLDARLVTPRS